MTITAIDILDVAKSVTKKWTKQLKAEERSSKSRGSRMYVYSDRVKFTEVAHRILPDAYKHASGDGRYPVSKRQLFYACREKFREETGRQLEYGYFSGTLLVQYMNRTPATEAWEITRDPRGTLSIPNASYEVRVPCGTIQMEAHLKRARKTIDPFDIESRVPVQWPSLAGGQRFQGVLYIEKEGFEPILKEARIAERFDLAILSCKGQSVIAARQFVDHVCRVNGGVPLLTVHDMDKSGFEIAQRLTTVSDRAIENDTVAYEFKNEIQVTDLGLRLADAQKYGLADEEWPFVGGFANDSLCTPEEREFLRTGRRVELNAFTSPQFIEWIIAKLSEHLPQRLIPDDQVLEDAYRRAVAVAHVNAALADALAAARERGKNTAIPKNIRRKLEHALQGNDRPWDAVLYDLVKEA